jgi:cytochrome c556
MKRALALFLLLAACAQAGPPMKAEPQQELEAARQQLLRDEQELMGTRAESRPVDCARARQLADNLCAVAERICALVARLPADPAHAGDCADARGRCKAARDRVQGRCPK